MNQSYESKLEKGRILVYGVISNAVIVQQIGSIYTPERLEEGQRLYLATKDAFRHQNNKKIESTLAYGKFSKAQNVLYAQMVKIRKTARYFFKNDYLAQSLLQLNNSIPNRYADRIAFSKQTINAVATHENIQARLTVGGVTPHMIADTMTLLDDIDSLKLETEKKDGEAQMATVTKNKHFKAFMTYCSDLRACLNLFFEGHARHELEKVGITVK
ncbi:hypothetical protein DMA11_18195 [Marinilabiliaceae bacterium JC017]|nr:hypothetical protein DMA11_18195 [Marinilabiliaceae bacterium JC017]